MGSYRTYPARPEVRLAERRMREATKIASQGPKASRRSVSEVHICLLGCFCVTSKVSADAFELGGQCALPRGTGVDLLIFRSDQELARRLSLIQFDNPPEKWPLVKAAVVHFEWNSRVHEDKLSASITSGTARVEDSRARTHILHGDRHR
ncbi:uncharacterized protein LAESUDRAFT_159623 [Laetiporus sulphureus 93-53]|uniref:Uncharacterized protein n=1 Tax=Laetiporus sulphureus 93-53 TaxID=1314785 RepID=A0A165HMX0_9APHY|nr:uncharacterized protein LAESUDRAFT_159623 [Laetiporus sulphureus 93-53]KZT11945.1 hypothetical protein LAESUDRAFT_159623 [Laetiporus sulphureus 93-53]